MYFTNEIRWEKVYQRKKAAGKSPESGVTPGCAQELTSDHGRGTVIQTDRTHTRSTKVPRIVCPVASPTGISAPRLTGLSSGETVPTLSPNSIT